MLTGGVRFYSADNKADIIEEYVDKGFKHFSVPDSRQGWAESLQHTIDSHYDGVTKLVIDISDIRERGAEIKGFGGIASGPAPLVTMLKRVAAIIGKRVGDYVTPTEWGDVIQNIGTCVVAGNVRRTALILIGDQDDKEYIESKNYSLEGNKVASQWRWASNNSVDIGIDTDKETLRNLAVNIFYNGEPGYVNIELSKNFGRIIDGFQADIDGEVEVFNPCGEITLPFASPCNLFEINLPRIHQFIEAGYADESLYELVLEFAAQYAYRITFRPYEWAATRDVVYRHRRIGVGLTGVTDWVLIKFGEKAILGFEEDGTPIYNPEVAAFLDKMYNIVRKANKEQAEELEATISIKVTTIKPSGTISLLMGVSPGQHYHWSKYMMRTVRISSNSFLLPILEQCGYKIETLIKGYNEDGSYVYDETTKVVYFPIKAPTADHPLFQSAYDVSLSEQAALQALLATYWSDNAVSATLSFHKPKAKPLFFENGDAVLDKEGNQVMMTDVREENAVIDEITDILDRYKGIIKSTSLLPHTAGTYPQMPYTTISEEEYVEASSIIVAKPWELIKGDILADTEEVEEDNRECVGGHCPTK
jgi:adenosylcobalamin-dependent ribonucleoside-triphosphate reductase